jgi:NADH-quinone oxidoreductase subunit H
MHDLILYIEKYLDSNLTPGGAGNIFWATVYILLVFGGLSVAVIAMNWLERKILAHMQVRLGPMRVGPHGLLQPIADAIKLLLKEDIIPAEADKIVFWIAPFIVVLAAFTVFVVVPFGPTHAITDMNIGILFMLGVSSLSVLGIVTAGWASNSHYPLIGALRSSAQMVSYEVAMGLAVLSVILLTSLHGVDLGLYGTGASNPQASGTLSMIGIVQAQQEQGVWFVFKFFPLGLIGFFIFAIAMVAETNRAPFDLPEAESELTAGFHTEYSGFRWSLFFLAEYSAMIAVSSIAVTLWLGGWLRPFPALHGPIIMIPHLWTPADPAAGALDFVFALFPGLTFLFFAAICFFNTARMPKHPLFKIQTIGLAGFGAVLGLIGLLMFIPAVRDRVGDIFWFSAKVAAFMYLYIWYRGTFPRYRFDQLMKVGWKVLMPTGLALLIATALVAMRAEVWAGIIVPIWLGIADLFRRLF